jgi:hypothetical protein
MNQFILSKCADMGVRTVVKDGNIYATKGDAAIFPCIVAHTDTVHRIKAKNQYKVVVADDLIFAIDPKNMDTTGVGGDDKVGIFLALSLLNTLPAAKAVFFRDEEIGCVGSREADMDFFVDCSFVLQGDRNGNSDFIRVGAGTELFGDEFEEAIAPYLSVYGYKSYDWGSISDVIQLKNNGLPIACANVSCGYYNAHSSKEMVSIQDVAATLGLFTEICENLADQQWFHTDTDKKSRGRYVSSYNYGYGSYYSRDKYESTETAGTKAVATGRSSVTINGVLYESFDDYMEKKRAATEAYLDGSFYEVTGEGESEEYTKEDIAAYLRGGSDDETAMGSVIDPACPLCDTNINMMWDTAEEEYFCMVCQLYEGEARAVARTAVASVASSKQQRARIRVGA